MAAAAAARPEATLEAQTILSIRRYWGVYAICNENIRLATSLGMSDEKRSYMLTVRRRKYCQKSEMCHKIVNHSITTATSSSLLLGMFGVALSFLYEVDGSLRANVCQVLSHVGGAPPTGRFRGLQELCHCKVVWRLL